VAQSARWILVNRHRESIGWADSAMCVEVERALAADTG